MSDAKSLEASLLHVSNLNGDGSRKRLIITGSNLEDAVTFQCLEASAHRFDVFLPSDLITVSKPMFASLHWDRLKQAGAIPTTMVQMLSEWSLCANDISTSESIARCASEFGELEL